MARLENWSITGHVSPYDAPETVQQRLVGNVYGHPEHYDGKYVVTSRIVSLDGECVITSSGTVYELGAVDPDYVIQFPNAKERLLASFQKIQ